MDFDDVQDESEFVEDVPPDRQGSYRSKERIASAAILTESLGRQAMRARRYGFMAMLFTLLNIGIFAAAGITSRLPRNSTSSSSLSVTGQILIGFAVAGVLTTLVALVVLALQETARRAGESYFQELSDIVQVLSNQRISRNEGTLRDARLASRLYRSNVNLPLVPGGFGPAIYALVNLVLLIINASFFNVY